MVYAIYSSYRQAYWSSQQWKWVSWATEATGFPTKKEAEDWIKNAGWENASDATKPLGAYVCELV